MTTKPPAKKARMGRPGLPPELKTHPHTVYFTDAQWAEVQERGQDWLRGRVDAARKRKK